MKLGGADLFNVWDGVL